MERKDKIALDLLQVAIEHARDRSFLIALESTMSVALDETHFSTPMWSAGAHRDADVRVTDRMTRGDFIALGMLEVASETAQNPALRTALRVTYRVAVQESRQPDPNNSPGIEQRPHQVRVTTRNCNRHLLKSLPARVIEPIPRAG